jgi:hypothetical protein
MPVLAVHKRGTVECLLEKQRELVQALPPSAQAVLAAAKSDVLQADNTRKKMQ